MERDVLRRIKRGFGANAYSLGVVVVIQLAGVPILLHAWGTQLYGEWLILAAVPVSLSMADLGFSQSAGNDMTARMGHGDVVGALAVLQSLAALVYGFALLGLLLVTLLIFLLPLNHWFHFTHLSVVDARWILWLFAAEVLVKLLDGVNHAGFRANGDYAMQIGISASTMLVQQLGVWGLSLAGHGPLDAAVWFAIVRFVVTPATIMLLYHRHSSLRPGFAHARWIHLQGLVRPSLANLAMPIALALNIQGMVLVVAAVMGPTAVVVFSVLRTLTRFVVQGIAVVTHSLEPEVARAWGQGNSVLIRTLYIRSAEISGLLAAGSAAVLYFLGNWIVAFWTHGKVVMHPALYDWLLLSAITTVLWHSGINFLKALNRHVRAAIWFVVTSGASVSLAYLLLRWTHDLAGAGIALVVADVLLGIYAVLQVRRITGINWSHAS